MQAGPGFSNQRLLLQCHGCRRFLREIDRLLAQAAMKTEVLLHALVRVRAAPCVCNVRRAGHATWNWVIWCDLGTPKIALPKLFEAEVPSSAQCPRARSVQVWGPKWVAFRDGAFWCHDSQQRFLLSCRQSLNRSCKIALSEFICLGLCCWRFTLTIQRSDLVLTETAYATEIVYCSTLMWGSQHHGSKGCDWARTPSSCPFLLFLPQSAHRKGLTPHTWGRIADFQSGRFLAASSPARTLNGPKWGLQ